MPTKQTLFPQINAKTSLSILEYITSMEVRRKFYFLNKIITLEEP